jgi:hypothetical protein
MPVETECESQRTASSYYDSSLTVPFADRQIVSPSSTHAARRRPPRREAADPPPELPVDDILEVKPDATDNELKKSYRKLAVRVRTISRRP